MQSPESSNIITAMIAGAGGTLIVYLITRIFSKSEDSASKEYVDATRDKLEAKIEKKVSQAEFDSVIGQLKADNRQIISILLDIQKQTASKK